MALTSKRVQRNGTPEQPRSALVDHAKRRFDFLAAESSDDQPSCSLLAYLIPPDMFVEVELD